MNEYIGIPFEELDCYAIVRKIFKEQHGIELIDFKIRHDEGAKVYAQYIEYAKQWKKLDKPKAGCVIALRYDPKLPRFVTHFAYCVSDTHMIHTSSKTGSILEPIERYTKMTEGFYEFVGNSQ